MARRFNKSMIRASGLLVLGALAVAVACNHKELRFDLGSVESVEIVFDWRDAPAGEAETKAMSVVFYPLDGSNPWRMDFGNSHGGTMNLPSGKPFRAICISMDTQGFTHEQTDSYENFHVLSSAQTNYEGMSFLTVRNSSLPKADVAKDEPAVNNPSSLYAAHKEDITIELGKEGQQVVFYPTDRVYHYKVIVRNVENGKYVADGAVGGTLTGMAAGEYIVSGEPAGGRATYGYSFNFNADKTELTSEFLAFSHGTADDHKHTVSVYTILQDGSKWYQIYDNDTPKGKNNVTEQLHNGVAAQQRVITIELDGLHLPDRITNGNGFDPTVGSWNESNITIDM